MKSKIAKSRKYKSVIPVVLVLLIPVVFGLYFSMKSILYIDKFIEPITKQISVNSPLIIDMRFNNEVGEQGAIDEFIKYIDKAKHSIEIATFTFRSNKLREALDRADKRGVEIAIILDSSRAEQHDFTLKNLSEKVKRIDSGKYDKDDSKKTSYMHHKFMIIDRNREGAELVSGSLNFTDAGARYNQSFYFNTMDKTLISIYGNEFDLLKSGVTGAEKFKNEKYSPFPASIQYADSFLEVWMSPGYPVFSVQNRIEGIINSAISSIDIMAWYLTDEKIAEAIIKKSREGVNIRIIAEDSNATTTDSVLPLIMSAKEANRLSNIEIILDTKLTEAIKDKMPEGFNPYFHQHTMLVDSRVVVFGTNNWGKWGFYKNDEDTIVTDNKYLIGEFQNTFNYFYRTLK